MDQLSMFSSLGSALGLFVGIYDLCSERCPLLASKALKSSGSTLHESPFSLVDGLAFLI